MIADDPVIQERQKSAPQMSSMLKTPDPELPVFVKPQSTAFSTQKKQLLENLRAAQAEVDELEASGCIATTRLTISVDPEGLLSVSTRVSTKNKSS
ncbi:hypothetical protein KKG41_04820 [Patescibacteria group bacterium]|nr:hypothetical protein [Patescibacteria group bacterium]